MNSVEDLKEYVRSSILQFPHHEREIQGILEIALDEIHDGASVENECSLAVRDIEDLTE